MTDPDPHPLADVAAVVVDPDDVVSAMRNNRRDADQPHEHTLRVTPPFVGTVTASAYVSETGARYPPEIDPAPLHIAPAAVVVGDDAGRAHPDFREAWLPPDPQVQVSLFGDAVAAGDRHGADAVESNPEAWDAWYETVDEAWADAVRHACRNTEQIRLTSQYPDVADTTVALELAGEEAES